VTTGLGDGGGDLLLPPAPVGEAHRVCGAVLGVEPSPTAVPLRRHPTAAPRRQVVGAVRPVLAVAAVLVLTASDWTWPWPLDWTVPLPFDWTWPLVLDRTWLAVLGLVPCAVLLGWDRYRSLGHALTDRHLIARRGSRTRVTVALQRTGIIGWNLSQTFFQRRAGLVTLSAITAAGDGVYHVVDIAESDGLALADGAVPGLWRAFLESDAVDDKPQHQ
jgi:putative membrane protein